MANLNNISLEYILQKVGVLLDLDDIFYICDDTKIIIEYMDFFGKEKPTVEKIVDFLLSHKDKIDKENLIVMGIKNGKVNINIINEEIKKVKKKLDIIVEREDDKLNTSVKLIEYLNELTQEVEFQKANVKELMKIGKNIQKCIVRYNFDSELNEYDMEVIDSVEVIKGKNGRNPYNIERFKKIDEHIKAMTTDGDLQGIECLFQGMILTDYKEIFNPNAKEIANKMRCIIIDNNLLKLQGMTCKELENMKENNIEEYIEFAERKYTNERESYIKQKEILSKYIKHIDIDKLLLISAYRFEQYLEKDILDEDAQLVIKNFLNKIIKDIENTSLTHTFVLQQILNGEYYTTEVRYSAQDIKECLKRFSDNSYLTKKYIKETKDAVNQGEKVISEINPEHIEICFNEEELNEIAMISDENFIFVSKKLNWDKDTILSKIKSMGRCSDDLFGYLVWESKSDILAEDIFDLYINNIIDEHQIRTASFAFDFSTILNEHELLKLYEEKEKDENSLEKYEKYIILYKLILTKDKTVDFEKHSENLMIEITENYDLKNVDKHIQTIEDFYKRGVLSLGAIVEWNDEDVVKKVIEDLYATQSLKFDEVKDLLIKRKIPFEFMAEIVFNEDISYEERRKILLEGWVPEEEIIKLYSKALIRKDDLIELASKSVITVREAQKAIQDTNILTLEANSNIKLNISGMQKITRDESIYTTDGGSTSEKTENVQIIDPNAREELLDLLHACVIPRKTVEADGVEVNKESPFYNYTFYGIPDENGKITEDSVIIAERIYEDIDTEARFAVDNATYFFKYGDLLVLSNYAQKDDVIKQIDNMVFRVSHCMATEERRGSWGKGVVEAVVKTILSSDLKDFSKKEKELKVLDELEKHYTMRGIEKIIDKALDIDFGDHICEIINGKAKKTNEQSTETRNTSCKEQPNNGDNR